MSDQRESIPPAVTHDGAGSSEGVPVARPVAVGSERPDDPRNREFLLLDEPRSSAWMDIALMVLFMLASEVVLGTLLGITASTVESLRNLSESELTRALLVPALVLRAIVVVALTTIILRHRGQGRRALGLVWSRPLGQLGAGVLAMVIAYGFIAIWMVLLGVLMPGVWEDMEENANRLIDLVPPMSPPGFVLFALLVGLYEEVLFRGFLMPRLRRATGSWVLAVLLSTVPFALPHMADQEPVALGPIAILSIVFSVVTIMRQSIVPAIVGHTLFDLSQFLSLSYQAGDSWT